MFLFSHHLQEIPCFSAPVFQNMFIWPNLCEAAHTLCVPVNDNDKPFVIYDEASDVPDYIWDLLPEHMTDEEIDAELAMLRRDLHKQVALCSELDAIITALEKEWTCQRV